MTQAARPDPARISSGSDYARPGRLAELPLAGTARRYVRRLASSATRRPRSHGLDSGWTLVSAGLSPVLVTVGWLVADAVQPASYNPVRKTVSVMSGYAGTDRWIMTGALLLAGVCQLLTAAGLTILAGTVRSTALALIAAVAVAALLPVIRSVRSGEPVGAWWRPAVAAVTAPLGLAGYWAYSAWATHHLAGFAWVEENAHNSFDWGKGIILAAKQAIISGPTAGVALTLLVIAAAVILTGCSLAERIPVYLHAYTLVVVLLALTPGPYYLGSKPRFLLPAMLLGLPLARLLAKAPIWVLIPLIAVLAAASTWFGIYLMTTGWAP